MARNVLGILLLSFLLTAAWAEDRLNLSEDDEERWNTPPELIPEQIVRKSDLKDGRTRLLPIPVSASINLGTKSGSRTMAIQVGPEGLNVAGSKSYNRAPSGPNGTSVAGSRSMSLSANRGGIAGARSRATVKDSVHGNEANVRSRSFSRGDAKAEAHAAVENGEAVSGARTSADSTNTGTSGTNLQRPTQNAQPIVPPELQEGLEPAGTSFIPVYVSQGYHTSRRPTLSIETVPHGGRRRGPVRLLISTGKKIPQRNRPTVHVRKWQPGSSSSTSQEVSREILATRGPIQLQISPA